MNNDYTHITMIIDRSGSMSSCWSDVVGGYSEIVKKNKEAEGKCTFTVAAFDTEYDLLEDFTPIKKVNDKLEVLPRGGTALLDALGKTIVSVGEKLAKMKEKDRPTKVMVVVQTDGEENASREYTKNSVKELIERQQNVYNWQFQFIGASLASISEAESWGFRASNVSTYEKDNSCATFDLLGEKMLRSRSAPDLATYVASVQFNEEDRKALNSKKETTTTK